MKDRIPKYPGRVKLTPVAGKTDVFDMVRADEPEEAGSPLNKKTLLTDEAAMEVGLKAEDDPTPSDAFLKLGKKLGKTEWKCGDVIETMRTDLGEKWILCNGDVVPGGSVPVLHNVLPYNTEWKLNTPYVGIAENYQKYKECRPLSKPGKWLFIYSFFDQPRDAAAALYDAETDTLTEIVCPTIAGETESYGIFGLTHDGDRYVLGVTGGKQGNLYNKQVWFFVSTDLVNWEMKYTEYAFQYCKGKDMIFDGTNIVWYERSDSSNYKLAIKCIDKNFGTSKKLHSTSSSSVDLGLTQLPAGYWCHRYNADSSRYIYTAGSRTNGSDYFAAGKAETIAFFSERYWIGLQSSSMSAVYILDLTGHTRTEKTVTSITGAYRGTFLGMDYDRNTNEWILYCNVQNENGAPYANCIAVISADANPTDTAQYNVYYVETLPENKLTGQMSPDRALLYLKSATLKYLRDPNQKYLPTHDSETYKYIYTGEET